MLLDDLCAGNVGRHQVGRKLNATEGDPDRAGHGRHEQCLGESRHAHQKRVVVAEDALECEVDEFVLPHDYLVDLMPHPIDQFAKLGGDTGADRVCHARESFSFVV